MWRNWTPRAAAGSVKRQNRSGKLEQFLGGLDAMELRSLVFSLNAGTSKIREQIKHTHVSHGGSKGLISGPPLGMKI